MPTSAMSLFGTAAFLDALEDLTTAWGSRGSGYRVGTNVEYAVHQEFGTTYQSGTPHVRPSVDVMRARMGQIAVDADGLDPFLKRTALELEGEIKTRAPVDTGRLWASYATSEL